MIPKRKMNSKTEDEPENENESETKSETKSEDELEIEDESEIIIMKKCRGCGEIFEYSYHDRERTFCSAECFNTHRVVNVVELDGLHTVYNITVDDNHTVCISLS